MADKDQDDMLREAALARGFRLIKSRRRKPGGDFGRYGLVGLESGRECLGFGAEGLTATPEEVHAYLRGGEVAAWKRSLIGVVETPPPEAPAPDMRAARPERSGAASEPKQKERAVPSPKARPGVTSVRPVSPDPTPAAADGAGPGSSAKQQPLVELSIREATRRDAALLAKLVGIPAPLLAERIAAAVKAGEPPLVAARADAAAGIAAWTIIPTLDHGPRGRLTLLLVAQDSRRHGIGTALLRGVEARLAEAGVTDLELLLDIDFDAPTAFLRGSGYTRRTNGYGK